MGQVGWLNGGARQAAGQTKAAMVSGSIMVVALRQGRGLGVPGSEFWMVLSWVVTLLDTGLSASYSSFIKVKYQSVSCP